MRRDKEKAFQLRKEGKTYRQIKDELGISKSTLCDWFRDVPWSRHLKSTYTKYIRTPEHLERMRSVRKENLQLLYTNTEKEAVEEYSLYRNEPLFWAGLMVYAGEGDKRSKNLVRVTNSEFYLHKIFIAFAVKYLKFPKEDIRCSLILYPDLNETLCKEMWSNILQVSRDRFHKTQVIQGKELRRKLQYGVGMSIISSTVLKRKILKWVSLAQDERFDMRS